MDPALHFRQMPGSRSILLILFLLGFLASAHADLRAPFLRAEKSYNEGDLDDFASQLMGLKPANDEERAFISFYSAMIEANTAKSKDTLLGLRGKYPSTRYGQQANLELAKMEILARNIPEAKRHLAKVTSPELSEKSYWQSICAFQENDWQAAINHADNYLRATRDKKYLEEMHYQIAECYLNQEKYFSAQTTMLKLKNLKGYPTDLQYYHYRLGYAYEKNGAKNEALSSYTEGYLINKYSQLAYQIEDRLFEMRSRYGASFDLSFLYPYTELQIVKETEPSGTPNQAQTSSSSEIMNQPYKITERVSGKLYLQAGRFSLENNAGGLVKTIREMSLPSAYYEALHNNQTTWVVLCGPFNTRSDAVSAQDKLREHGIDCFITSS